MVPMDDLNLHFTGNAPPKILDTTNESINLQVISMLSGLPTISSRLWWTIISTGEHTPNLTSLVNTHRFRRNEPVLDVRKTTWRRVVDMNDRALRDVSMDR